MEMTKPCLKHTRAVGGFSVIYNFGEGEEDTCPVCKLEAEIEKLKYELDVMTVAYESLFNESQAEVIVKQDKQIERHKTAFEEILLTKPICCDGKPNGDYACDLHIKIAKEALKGGK